MADAKAKYNKLSNAQVIKVSKWLAENWDRLKKDKVAREALVAEIQTGTGASVNWGQLLRHCREDYDEPKNLAEICVGGRATGDVARSDRPRLLAEWAERKVRKPSRPRPAPAIPAVGSVVELGKSLESFGGFIAPGPVKISAAYVGGCGRGFVNLARDGRVVATGVAWPVGV